MSRNGITEEMLAKKIQNGEDFEGALKKVREALNYREVNKSLIESLVKHAGGTDEEALKAKLVIKSIIDGDGKTSKKDLDELGKKMAADAAQAAWDKWDDEIAKPYFEAAYKRADALLAEHKKAEADKVAKSEKKEKAKKEAKVESPKADEKSAVDGEINPFEN
jgi:hypothetical protein